MPTPQMIDVVSSNVAQIGYDENERMVYVRFNNGMLYTYKEVPLIEYEGLINAPSIGSYINKNFKNVYSYERIE